MDQKGFGRKRSWPDPGTAPYFPEGIRKITKKLSQDGWGLNLPSNTSPKDYRNAKLLVPPPNILSF
jgi:hypothetical protein